MKAGKVPLIRHLTRAIKIGQVATAINIPQQVIVPDVSFWQDLNDTLRKIDFAKMKANGARGVIIRAGQNIWPDPDFDDYWRDAKAAGLPRGTYYFFDSRRDPISQAELFYSKFKNDMPEMEIVADYEENYGGPYGGWQNFRVFLDTLRSKGIPASKIAIYSGYYYWIDHSPQTNAANLAYFKQYKIWIAWYTANPANVSIPKPWTNDDLLAWQFTSSGDGHAYGVESNAIDLNWWNTTPAEFDQRYGGIVQPPPTGGNMIIQGTVKAAQLNIRPDPSNNMPAVGLLAAGDTVEADRNTNQWLHLTKVNGVAVTGEKWASAGATQQYITWAWVDVTPPPPGTVLPKFNVAINSTDADVQSVSVNGQTVYTKP